MILTRPATAHALRKSGLLGGAAAVAFAMLNPAHAQQSPSLPQQPDDAQQADIVVITGTRIANTAPVGATVNVMTSEEILEFPATNVVDMLNRQPAFSGAGNNESVRVSVGPGAGQNNLSRGSDINLRGIGPSATLVLFDGGRIPATGSIGGAHDVSTIPQLALNRIDVVADGSSALYGSDAVSGVVNFIPRHTYDGVTVRTQAAFADGYDKTYLGFILGDEWDGGGWVIAAEASHATSLKGTERDFYRSDNRANGGTDYRSTLCNPGNLVVGGVSYAIPAGGVTSASQLLPNTQNRCENTRRGDLIPETDLQNVWANLTHEITPWLTARVHGLYSERTFLIEDITVGSQNLQVTGTLPAANAFFVRPPGTTGAVTFQRLFDDNGLLKIPGLLRWQDLGFNLEFKLPADWTGSLDFDAGRIDSTLNTRGYFATRAATILASSNPATALNVYGANSFDVMNQAFSNYYDPTGVHYSEHTRLNVGGALFNMPGGEVKLAVGAEHLHLQNNLTNHVGDFFTLNTRPEAKTVFHRYITSGYAELLVPIFGDDFTLPGFQSLDLSVAWRYDDYSDLGPVDNPKIGIDWKPIDALKLRASYGTSFVAPAPPASSPPSIGSTIAYQSAADPSSSTGTSYGVAWVDNNADIGPEAATNWTAGFDFEPDFIPGFRASATFFSIDYEDKITVVRPPEALANPLLSRFVIRNPTQAQIDALTGLGLRVTGAPVSNPAWIVDQRPQNLGGLRLEGVDVTLDWEGDLPLGELAVGFAGTFNTKFEVAAIDGAPYVDQLNQTYNPLDFRGQLFATLTRGPWLFDVRMNHVGGYTNHLSTPQHKVDSYTTFDARLGYDIDTPGVFEGTSLSLQVSNLFDEDPPFVDVDGGVNPAASSILGRMVSVTLSKDF